MRIAQAQEQAARALASLAIAMTSLENMNKAAELDRFELRRHIDRCEEATMQNMKNTRDVPGLVESVKTISKQIADLPVVRDRQGFIIRMLGWGGGLFVAALLGSVGWLISLVLQMQRGL